MPDSSSLCESADMKGKSAHKKNWTRSVSGVADYTGRSSIVRIRHESSSRRLQKPTVYSFAVRIADDLVVDKNRQVLISRKQPSWQTMLAAKRIQTFGRDVQGNVVPLFGVDPANVSRQSLLSNQDPIQPYLPQAPTRESGTTYRTSGGQNVVFIPAAQNLFASTGTQIVPAPAASYLVTATPAVKYVEVVAATRPPQIQYIYPSPQQPTVQAAPEYLPLKGVAPLPPQTLQAFTAPPPAPNMPVYTAPTAPPLPYSTFAPSAEELRQEEIHETAMNNDCSMGQCEAIPSEDKCNSLRLRNIIMNVPHTDEFCLASSGGVNCYVFSPVCSSGMELKKARKKIFVNRN
ncbi:unnamed protein product [Caenorhabditis auriculariae]|uniref:Uncharacterized protein n=1 Tax=Caenorhabditis auriculariae TaxID=2777116 RepID=A0A8S1HGA3_9PELO|nr:unnamed protein product [Caenorhabditis auriculariae]